MTTTTTITDNPRLHTVAGLNSFAPMLASPQHPAWSHREPMPSWAQSFRPHQIMAIGQVVDSFSRVDTVILDAPVGSGKTLIAECVRRELSLDACYICSTLTLQDQFVSDFPNARTLKGRRNYPTLSAPSPKFSCDDCTLSSGSGCLYCDEPRQCPYTVTKEEAMAASTAVLNTAYFLTECNHVGRFSKRGLAIADEADLLEGALMGFIEVELADFWQKRLRIKPPKVKTAEAQSNDWEEWATDAWLKAADYLSTLPPYSRDPKVNKHIKRTKGLVSRLFNLKEEVGDGTWVYDGYNQHPPKIIFRPLKVDEVAKESLWDHAGKWLLMSGSVISPDEMADSLGIDEFESITVDTGWDHRRRPVFISPVANVVWKEKGKAYPEVAKTVVEIIDSHPGERILVHGVSYQLTAAIVELVGRKVKDRAVFTYTKASEREAALDGYVATAGAVIVAPSLDRGVDFKDDLARVQIICKVPYMSLGDKRVAKRTNMNQAGSMWFATQTVRTFVQMVGRGMRHEGDWCVTYVIDEQMTKNVLRRSRGLIPTWLREAMVRGRTRPWLTWDGIDLGEDDE